MLDEMVISSIHRFEKIGYTERFDTAPGGLRSEHTGVLHPADALVADHLVSLGTATAGAGPTLLFALRSKRDGARGTWVVARDAGLPREAQLLVDRLASANPKRTWTRWVPQGGSGAGEFILEGMMVGVLGACIVGVWLLLYDFAQREAFFTPSLVADHLFGRDDGARVLDVDLGRAATVIAIHGGLFVLFGIAAAWVVSRYVKHPSVAVLFVALFVTLEVAFLLGAALVIPGVPAQIGHVPIVVANALAALGMGLYLRRTEPHPAQTDARAVPLKRSS